MNRKDKIEALKRQLILHPSYLTIIEEIEKDLELLEILKKHYNINSLTISLDNFISITINKTDKDFEKIKEWLDEEEKEERMEND